MDEDNKTEHSDSNKPTFEQRVVEIIKNWFTNSGFKDRKLTDTPTDALQVVNKKYVDSHGQLPVYQAPADTDVIVYAGDATGNNDGGGFSLLSGIGSGTGQGGQATFSARVGGGANPGIPGGMIFFGSKANGNGGDSQLSSGSGNQAGTGVGDGAVLSLTAGDAGATSGNGGTVVITLGTGHGGGTNGNLSLVNLPTSAAGLPLGSVWIDTTAGANILKIV